MPMPNFLLDACVVLAYLDDEIGAEIVSDLFEQASMNKVSLYMNAVNLIEVYYDRIRAVGAEEADATIQNIYNDFPVTVIETITPKISREAAYYKSSGKMSFADSILIATAKCINAVVVSCDHAELESVEKQGLIQFLWIRP
ncbi:MAG: type II toxin-antitoxin system VapC family toxin [Treponema sp.]|nr:type II toxin-antitoxin system VapC family toxin [Treponema sp.]